MRRGDASFARSRATHSDLRNRHTPRSAVVELGKVDRSGHEAEPTRDAGHHHPVLVTRAVLDPSTGAGKLIEAHAVDQQLPRNLRCRAPPLRIAIQRILPDVWL